MKTLFIVLSITLLLLISFGCSSSKKIATETMANIGNELADKINQQESLRDTLAKKIFAKDLDENQYKLINEQLKSLDEEISHLKMRLEYSEGSRYGYYSRNNAKVVIDFDPNNPKDFHRPKNTVKFEIVKSGRLNDIIITELSNGKYQASGPGVKRPEVIWDNLVKLLVNEFGANENNISQLKNAISWKKS